MRLQQKGSDTWVEGGHLPHPMKLPDRIELNSDTEFTLLGRPGDMAKIAGKRVSLEALNHELQRVPGVRDGVFFVPDDCPPGEARLAALVVAPELDAGAILRALRERIDSVFLPRPLLIVDALPRGATGKIPREGLLALAEAAQARSWRSA
jgi:acyl-coenzyme A synthetase/AMP-(fatty) acid ligase